MIKIAQQMLHRRLNAGFEAYSFGKALEGLQVSTDPVLNVDAFRMSEPTFDPHPHAMFSAVTILSEESVTSMLNRDSKGDQSIIEPGGVHWTTAGSGIVHEETPLEVGKVVSGFQVFVNLPRSKKWIAPFAQHLKPADVPVAKIGSVKVRVLAGEFENSDGTVLRSRIEHHTEALNILDLHFTPTDSETRLTIPVDARRNTFGIVYKGAVRVSQNNETNAQESPEWSMFFSTNPEQHKLSIACGPSGQGTGEARVLLFSGSPIGEPVFQRGPFIGNTEQDIVRARSDFEQGKMGTLSPLYPD